MTHQDYLAAAELYLGSDWKSAAAHGSRKFSSAAKALRFAIEEAAPVSLRGARLTINDRSFARADMLALYRSRRYPLARKNDTPDGKARS
jgi:hypothetical protein